MGIVERSETDFNVYQMVDKEFFTWLPQRPKASVRTIRKFRLDPIKREIKSNWYMPSGFQITANYWFVYTDPLRIETWTNHGDGRRDSGPVVQAVLQNMLDRVVGVDASKVLARANVPSPSGALETSPERGVEAEGDAGSMSPNGFPLSAVAGPLDEHTDYDTLWSRILEVWRKSK